MPRDRIYYEDAVFYNRTIAEGAEKALESLRDPTITKWVGGIARQHRFHEKRHQTALNRLNSHEKLEADVEQIPEGLDVPEPEDEDVNGPPTVAISEELNSEFHQEAAAAGEFDEPVVETQNTNVFSDGCVSAHKPLENANCDFNPSKVAANG